MHVATSAYRGTGYEGAHGPVTGPPKGQWTVPSVRGTYNTGGERISMYYNSVPLRAGRVET